MTDREDLAGLLCEGGDRGPCVNYDPDVPGGCSWCERDADLILASPFADRLLARGWDEGLHHGLYNPAPDFVMNPYRTEATP